MWGWNRVGEGLLSSLIKVFFVLFLPPPPEKKKKKETSIDRNWVQVKSALEVIYGSSEEQNQGVSQEGKTCFLSRHQRTSRLKDQQALRYLARGLCEFLIFRIRGQGLCHLGPSA
jgi:hypothetical protein